MKAEIVKIIVASPGDVQEERDHVHKVAAELNRTFFQDRALRLEVVRWETEVFPSFHPEGPQGLIDSIINIQDSDLFVGIFWKRFGSPAHDAKPDAEQEFREAYEAWKKNGRPQIMIYFNEESIDSPTLEQAGELFQLLRFKSEMPEEALWWRYKGEREFESVFRQHLTQFILQREKEDRGAPPSAVSEEKKSFVWDFKRESLPPDASSDTSDMIRRIEDLERRPASTPAVPDPTPELLGRLDKLEAKVNRTSDGLDKLGRIVVAMDERIEQISQEQTSQKQPSREQTSQRRSSQEQTSQERTPPPPSGDVQWRDWLRELHDSSELAFLTEEEMKTLHSDVPTWKKNELIATAVRRALPTSTLDTITHLEVVELSGRTVSYLVPNGEMESISMRDWVPGWKATVVFKLAGRKVEIPLYFLWEGMNPIRQLNTDLSLDSELKERSANNNGDMAWLTQEQTDDYPKLARFFEDGAKALKAAWRR